VAAPEEWRMKITRRSAVKGGLLAFVAGALGLIKTKPEQVPEPPKVLNKPVPRKPETYMQATSTSCILGLTDDLQVRGLML
jgi:hypothetical protein